MIKPNFFLMGPAAGSTSMYYYLKQHPEIFMSNVKEPLYFRKDLIPRGNLKNKFKESKDYYKLFKKADGKKIIGEATPTYIYSDTALEEIKKEIGSPKVIIMLREPVSFIESEHHYAYTNGYESQSDLMKALDAEKERMENRKNPKITSEKEMVYYIYLLRKIYDNVKKCMELFGRENVKVILQEELKKNQKKVYGESLDFLGVDTSFTPIFKVYNQRKSIRNRILLKIIRKLEELPPLFIRLIKIISTKSGRDFIREINTKPSKRNPIDPKVEERIKKEFREDVEKLGKLINKDLSHWTN